MSCHVSIHVSCHVILVDVLGWHAMPDHRPCVMPHQQRDGYGQGSERFVNNIGFRGIPSMVDGRCSGIDEICERLLVYG
jgi:hypothetical protein